MYDTKKSKERREEQVFWHQSEARTAATIWNWSGKTLSPGALLSVLYFSSCHIFFRFSVQTFLCPHYLPLGLRGWYGSYFVFRSKNLTLLIQLTSKIRNVFQKRQLLKQEDSRSYLEGWNICRGEEHFNLNLIKYVRSFNTFKRKDG